MSKKPAVNSIIIRETHKHVDEITITCRMQDRARAAEIIRERGYTNLTHCETLNGFRIAGRKELVEKVDESVDA